MLSENGDPNFANKITQSISNQISLVTVLDNHLSTYIKRFVSRGLIELVIIWIGDDDRPDPQEFIELVKKTQLLSPVQLILNQN
ncbi:TetR family transcriptional regulator C-terminal domain-containing protein [Weissella paramesenteroides]|nr:TetR family transcriptional regulator C-terminal domain-containing protein [Weissella paramesenteroides]